MGFGKVANTKENTQPNKENQKGNINEYLSELHNQPPYNIPFPIDENIYLTESPRPQTPQGNHNNMLQDLAEEQQYFSPQHHRHQQSPRNAVMLRIQKDLDSPSAAVRVRALKALKSPAKSSYAHFDVPLDEQSLITAEDRRTPPPAPTLKELMRKIVVYVEVRSGEDNRSAGVKQVISALGARVNDKLLRDTTHVIFKDGLLSTYKKAKALNIPVVSILWIEACKNHHKICNPDDFQISNIDRYENPELYDKMKRHKSMQPDSESSKRRRPKPGTPKETTTTPKTAANIRKTSTMIAGDTPNNNNMEKHKQTDISQFFKNFGSHKKTPKTILMDTVPESPATQLLNRINSNSFTPIASVSKKKKSPTAKSAAKPSTYTKIVDEFMPEDESRDVPVYTGGAANSPKIHEVKKALNFVGGATTTPRSKPTEQEKQDGAAVALVATAVDTPRRTSQRRRSLMQANLDATTTSIREMTLSNSGGDDVVVGAPQANSTALSSTTTPGRTRRRNSINVMTGIKVVSETPRSKLQQQMGKEFAAIAEEEGEHKAGGEAMKLATPKKRITKRRTTYTSKTLEISEVPSSVAEVPPKGNDEVVEKPVTKPTNRRRTLYTPRKMEESALPAAAAASSGITICGDLNKEVMGLVDKPLKSSSSNMSLIDSTPNVIASSTHLSAGEIVAAGEGLHTPKTLLEQHALAAPSVFSSTRQPGRRRTLFDFSMDIISARLQNINQSARRSMAGRGGIGSDIEVRRSSTDSETPMLNKSLTTPNLPGQLLEQQKAETPTNNKEVENNNVNSPSTPTMGGVTKKRKLFAPNDSLIMDMTPNPATPISSTQAGNNVATPLANGNALASSSSTIKRRRTLLPIAMPTMPTSESKLAPPATKRVVASGLRGRRSTMDFEAVSKAQKSVAAAKLKAEGKTAANKDPTTNGAQSTTAPAASEGGSNSHASKAKKQLPFMVYTNMHKHQAEVIREAVEKLGGYQLEKIVSEKTTHVVSLEPRRTLNLLRALARGLWILEYTWIVESLKAKRWLNEECFELRDFSRAVEICRAERQAFGNYYKCELFSSLGPFYVSTRCGPISKEDLKHLIELCGGRIVDNRKRAKYILGDMNKTLDDKVYITPFWILDSITQMQLLKCYKYSPPPTHGVASTYSKAPSSGSAYQGLARVQHALHQEQLDVARS